MVESILDTLSETELEKIRKQINKICPHQLDYTVIEALRTGKNISLDTIQTIIAGPKIPGNSPDITPNTPMHKVDAIRGGKKDIIRRKDISHKLIEFPAYQACLDLYDKNIKTIWASANYTDVEHHSFIKAVNLLPKNVSILGTISSDADIDHSTIYINIPTTIDTTVGEVQQGFKAITDKLTKQPLVWGFDSNLFNDIYEVENYLALNKYAIYDIETALVFYSLELYAKYHDVISPKQKQDAEKRLKEIKENPWDKHYQLHTEVSKGSIIRALTNEATWLSKNSSFQEAKVQLTQITQSLSQFYS